METMKSAMRTDLPSLTYTNNVKPPAPQVFNLFSSLLLMACVYFKHFLRTEKFFTMFKKTGDVTTLIYAAFS